MPCALRLPHLLDRDARVKTFTLTSCAGSLAYLLLPNGLRLKIFSGTATRCAHCVALLLLPTSFDKRAQSEFASSRERGLRITLRDETLN
jgi:hypothetical protein